MRAAILKGTTTTKCQTIIRGSSCHQQHNVANTIIRKYCRSSVASLPLHQIDCSRRESEDDNGTGAMEQQQRVMMIGDILALQQPPQYRTTELPSSISSLILSTTNRHHHHYPSSTTRSSHHQTLQQYRSYTISRKTERAPQAAILALGSIALTAKAGQYAMQAYNEFQKNQPAPPTEGESEPTTNESTDDTKQQDDTTKQKDTTDKKKTDGPRENIFEKYFNLGVGSKYYDGGFEEKMTRREAALILGVRESSTHKRIKEAHRKLLILNHPDTGGSTYLSGKINEAKDLLLKGRRAGQ